MLIVEDNRTNQLVLAAQLRRLGFHPHVVDCGRDAIHTFNQFRFSMVFMDCHMPGMDGFHTTREIRMQEKSMRLPKTPIIAVTADDSHDIKERCRASGMNECLLKPVRLGVLRKTIADWMPGFAIVP